MALAAQNARAAACFVAGAFESPQGWALTGVSSGNITTEETRRELAADEAVIAAAALVRNAVLRRALAIAAREYAALAKPENALPDAGIGLMVCWVMRATEELAAVK